MGKTTAQKGPNVVKVGARLKDVYATAVGDITKAYFFFVLLFFPFVMIIDAYYNL